MIKKIRIGTRSSKLALMQSGQMLDALAKNNPDLEFELVRIKTTGDRILDSPLARIGDKGLFTKEIENELIAGSIDLAVHSMKDMPTKLPQGLKIGAVTRRLDPYDAFISKSGKKIRELKSDATIATSSLRRKAQILASFPNFRITDIRGNVQSRLKKMQENPEIDGIILARAGLERLGMLDIITEIIHHDIILPAVGQASLAIEIRESDPYVEGLIEPLNHIESSIEIGCERAFLAELEGGCQVPVGALAKVDANGVFISGMVASLDGKIIFKGNARGNSSDFQDIGRNLAIELMDAGAKKILDEIYSQKES